MKASRYLPPRAKLERRVRFCIIPIIALVIIACPHFGLLLVSSYHFLLYPIDDAFVKGAGKCADLLEICKASAGAAAAKRLTGLPLHTACRGNPLWLPG